MMGTIGEVWMNSNVNVLLWTPIHGHTNVGQSAKTYIHQLCTDTRWTLEDLSRVMVDKNSWHDLMMMMIYQ